MKQKILILLMSFAAFISVEAKDYTVRGPQGGISFKISVPEGFDPEVTARAKGGCRI